jgi:signal transduction histidine kinase
MTRDSRNKSVHAAASEQQDFRQIARQVLEMVGTEFFSMLVKQLGTVLDSECLYIGEFLGRTTDRVRTLAACVEGGRMEAFEFPLAGSPAAKVATGSPCMYARGIRKRFPRDRLLGDLKAEAYVGVPLNDSEGQTRGLIAALFRQPLDLEMDFVLSMLKMFTPRASAELSRKHVEDLLRESEQRYRAFVQMNPDACWRVEFDESIDTSLPEEEQLARLSRSAYVAECNDALVQRLGLERPGQLVGTAVADAVLDKRLMHRSFQALIRSRYRHSTLQVTTVNRKGKRRHFLNHNWGIVENGFLQRVWGSSRDITELREIEAQLRHAQKLDCIGRLAAGVAHDFNNLLTVIRGYTSQLLERTKKADDPCIIGLTEILKAAEKGAALTNQLLAFSRKQGIELQPLDLKRTLREDEQMLRHLMGKNIELMTELEPSLGLVRANAGCMHQVLMNLTVNARDAMPNGGRLLITLSNVDIGETRSPRLAALEPRPYVRLSVTDNGMGMSPDVQVHLFEPFFTTKQGSQGSGLGLSTVYGIVRESGGHIVVESELNKGTTFEIFFPIESSQQIPT